MPRSGRKGTGKWSAEDASADVTLNDFANNAVSLTRIKKPTCHLFKREVKQLCTVGDTFYQNSLEDFDVLNLSDEDQNLSPRHPANKKHDARTKARKSQDSNNDGFDYPMDLWFCLAEYIEPEDVLTFASLCKSSLYVVRTYNFWIRMYKRYHKSGVQLPLRLQPECIERPYCLRVCVIRALYHMYPSFVNWLTPRPGFSVDDQAYKLVQSHCVSLWRIQNSNKWIFFFKLRTLPFGSTTNTVPEKHEKNLSWALNEDSDGHYDPLAILDDVNLNSDEGCKVLRITCSNFVSVPPAVMGSHLVGVHINLSRDLRHQRLQLIFSFSGYKCRYNSFASGDGGGNGEVLEFDPVENIQVLNWWHPQYPSSDKF